MNRTYIPELSILIPARNEMFLSRTVSDLVSNMRAKTEIIVVLDGAWPDTPIEQNDNVSIIFLPESVGQRAAINIAASVARGTYFMKMDAHCSVAEGFDKTLLDDMEYDWTMAPNMKNLHAFDWICLDCDWRKYQGPTPEHCPKCKGKNVERDILWKAKPSPNSYSFRFDTNLKFQYWNGYKKRQKGELVESLSLQGSCFMLHRDKYFDLNICDEAHGSWGQQGTEVALKTWLSGGRVIISKKTWYAHLFRTQGKDFSFPYPLSGKQVAQARSYSKKLFIDGAWDGAKHDLDWLLDKFYPVPEWHPPKDCPKKQKSKKANMQRKGILYYTDNRLDEKYAIPVRRQLEKIGIPIFSASLQPLDFGDNLVLWDKFSDMKPGPLTMFKQILAGLEALEFDIVFFAEHDVLYHPTHYDFTPVDQDTIYYNMNTWKIHSVFGFALFYRSKQTSGLCAHRDILIEHYRRRVAYVDQHGYSNKIGYEPGTHGRIPELKEKSDAWMSEYPNLDIRHDKNMTKTRWRKDQFRNQKYTEGWLFKDTVPGWGKTLGQFDELLEQI